MVELGISFGGGASEWRALADMTGTTTAVLDEKGFGNAVQNLVLRGSGAHLESRFVADLEGLTTCPFGYELARRAGYDPAAIILLARIQTFVQVHHQWLGTPIVHNVRNGRITGGSHIANGVFWLTAGDDALKARVVVDPLPEIMVNQTMGRPLRHVVTHPELDAMALRIVDVEQHPAKTHLIVEGVPAQVDVIEAMETWEEG